MPPQEAKASEPVTPDEEITLRSLQGRLDAHIYQFEEYKLNEATNWDLMLEAQESNTEAIRSLTVATQGLVEVWNTANAVQRFIKWASVFAVLGGVISWGLPKLVVLVGGG